ncbi:hypothetical protein C923_02302 [Plasmodium falciparum UGT5.1]|uniref:Uncharacterized protein n=2 Tax=Plasmodium falciparum UGT5.1 TaxID=1237627 RepID=W7JPL4_PLAFA|nr:hypothetical protein C923_02302 [Plasmodium falciparum UGT5.1]
MMNKFYYSFKNKENENDATDKIKENIFMKDNNNYDYNENSYDKNSMYDDNKIIRKRSRKKKGEQDENMASKNIERKSSFNSFHLDNENVNKDYYYENYDMDDNKYDKNGNVNYDNYNKNDDLLYNKNDDMLYNKNDDIYNNKNKNDSSNYNNGNSLINPEFIKNIGICYNIINDETKFENDTCFKKISDIIELRITQIIEEANKFYEKRKRYTINKYLSIEDLTNCCNYLNVVIPYKYKNSFFYNFITLNENYKNNKIIYRLISKKEYPDYLKKRHSRKTYEKRKKKLYHMQMKKEKIKNMQNKNVKEKNINKKHNKYNKHNKLNKYTKKNKHKFKHSSKHMFKMIHNNFIGNEKKGTNNRTNLYNESYHTKKHKNKYTTHKNKINKHSKKNKKEHIKKDTEVDQINNKESDITNHDKFNMFSENEKHDSPKEEQDELIKLDMNLSDNLDVNLSDNIDINLDNELDEYFDEFLEGQGQEEKYSEEKNQDLLDDDIFNFSDDDNKEESKEKYFDNKNKSSEYNNNNNNNNEDNNENNNENNIDNDNDNNNNIDLDLSSLDFNNNDKNSIIIENDQLNDEDIFSEDLMNNNIKREENIIKSDEYNKLDMSNLKGNENMNEKNFITPYHENNNDNLSDTLQDERSIKSDINMNIDNNILYNSYIKNNENKKKNVLKMLLCGMENNLPAETNITIFWLFVQNGYREKRKKKKKKNDKEKDKDQNNNYNDPGDEIHFNFDENEKREDKNVAAYFNYQCHEILYTIEKKKRYKNYIGKQNVLNEHENFKYNNIFLLPKFYPINKEYAILSKYILEIIKDIINYRINFFDYNNILHIFSTSKQINKILTNILFFLFNELDHNLRLNNIYASLMLLILLNGIIKNNNIDIDFYCLQILKMLIHVIIYEHELRLKNIYIILLLKRKACDIIIDFCSVLKKQNNNEIINIDYYLIYILSKLLTHNKCTYMHIYVSYYLIYLMPINIHIKFFLSYTPNFLTIFFKKYIYYQNVYSSFSSYDQKELNELFNFFFFHIYTLIQGSIYRIFKNINLLIINSASCNYLNYLFNFIINYADYHLPLILCILNVIDKNYSPHKNDPIYHLQQKRKNSKKRRLKKIKKIMMKRMKININKRRTKKKKKLKRNKKNNNKYLIKSKNYLKSVKDITKFYLNKKPNSDNGDDSYYEDDYLNPESFNSNIFGYNNYSKKQYFNSYIKKRISLNKPLIQHSKEKNELRTNIAVNNVLNKILNKFEKRRKKKKHKTKNHQYDAYLYDTCYYFLYTF